MKAARILILLLVCLLWSCEKPPKKYIHAQVDNNPDRSSLTIKNLDGFAWHNVRVFLNQYYYFDIPEPVAAKSSIEIGYEMFKDRFEETYDPAEEIYRMNIKADEGLWRL